MREQLLTIMALQGQYAASANTPAMQSRGAALRSLSEEVTESQAIAGAVALNFDDWAVQQSNGAGNAAKVPWVRVYVAAHSPSAQRGYYLVYLFSATGSRVYLSLNQGTTEPEAARMRRRPLQEIAARVDEARQSLASAPEITGRWSKTIDLDTYGGLGQGYELGNIYALEYSRESLPDEAQLRRDLREALQLQDRVYLGLSALPAPTNHIPKDSARPNNVNDENRTAAGPEVSAAQEAVEAAAGNRRRTARAGYGLTAAARRAIERHTVALTTDHLISLGYTVEDVGDTRSYDLEGTRPGEAKLYVEVKGTTSRGEAVVLTRNEVNLHQEVYPHNALAIVHSITLNPDSLITTGGHLHFECPWELSRLDLEPLAYTYTTPLAPAFSPRNS